MFRSEVRWAEALDRAQRPEIITTSWWVWNSEDWAKDTNVRADCVGGKLSTERIRSGPPSPRPSFSCNAVVFLLATAVTATKVVSVGSGARAFGCSECCDLMLSYSAPSRRWPTTEYVHVSVLIFL